MRELRRWPLFVLLRSLLAALIGVTAGACARRAPRADELAQAPALRTTDGNLAAENFEAELAQAERQHAERPADLPRTRALVDRLLAHARFFGRLADYDRAQEAADAAMALAPGAADAHLLRARVLAALHRFRAALAELDEAEQRAHAGDAALDEILRARVGIWEAMGQVDRAMPYLTAWRRDRPELSTYGAEASAAADKGDFARAAALFSEAKRSYRDVSPFAVAWLEYQEGHMWQIAGRLDRALALYESAHARLPGFAAAATHIAEVAAFVGDPDGARGPEAMLRPLVETADDPETVGELAALERELGHEDEAERLTRKAGGMFEALLRRHPEAFADHAARFYFRVGHDPARALALAEQNLSTRPTTEARALRDEIQRAVDASALAR